MGPWLVYFFFGIVVTLEAVILVDGPVQFLTQHTASHLQLETHVVVSLRLCVVFRGLSCKP